MVIFFRYIQLRQSSCKFVCSAINYVITGAVVVKEGPSFAAVAHEPNIEFRGVSRVARKSDVSNYVEVTLSYQIDNIHGFVFEKCGKCYVGYKAIHLFVIFKYVFFCGENYIHLEKTSTFFCPFIAKFFWSKIDEFVW